MVNEISFNCEDAWLNLFVGGDLYPVQVKTLMNPSTCGTFFRDVVKVSDAAIKVRGVQWETSPNHIKYRVDIDRDGLLFRHVLQYLRNGKQTSLPDDTYTLEALVGEAEFFGLEKYREMLKKKLWKLTGKRQYYACYSDSD
ncbi:hypothetical protein GCK72_010755 [Caenorhabditis remanei]|uniref:Potassium channel tetramerisation-type BTB domain-containing protein n=1 Tax=Caenorhabditis remanei TaxID=31234 RepID=E3LWU0_CAERE|nr:hypothetical protein GCK72_010755 [Caenorhabditis remanei]EFO83633.1 hypothetical protein CRE_02944 [Caenorhabditis remanei]KAF1762493.1 hypothetical protein GCK72_010755 [Caenorhabditis remanei]